MSDGIYGVGEEDTIRMSSFGGKKGSYRAISLQGKVGCD
jgi:hypothetical protein